MKMSNKWFLGLLWGVCFAALLTGCQGGALSESVSHPSSAQTAVQEPVRVSDIRLLTKWNGLVSGAAGEQGFYYPKVKDDGSMLLMYLDYATETETVLCANLSCEHRDDSCPAWISAN